PLRCRATEALARGAAANGELLDQVRASVLNDLRPRDSWRAAKAFRQQIIQVLAERVLTEALRPCGVSL
ncbi:MAG: hypothetical protein WBG37_00190, partial [Desulfobacterales bacterium]